MINGFRTMVTSEKYLIGNLTFFSVKSWKKIKLKSEFEKIAFGQINHRSLHWINVLPNHYAQKNRFLHEQKDFSWLPLACTGRNWWTFHQYPIISAFLDWCLCTTALGSLWPWEQITCKSGSENPGDFPILIWWFISNGFQLLLW